MWQCRRRHINSFIKLLFPTYLKINSALNATASMLSNLLSFLLFSRAKQKIFKKLSGTIIILGPITITPNHQRRIDHFNNFSQKERDRRRKRPSKYEVTINRQGSQTNDTYFLLAFVHSLFRRHSRRYQTCSHSCEMDPQRPRKEGGGWSNSIPLHALGGY